MATADILIEVLKVTPVTIVGVIALYVAWQQWKTNQQRLRHELYDRRLRIYTEVRKFISVALNDMQVETLFEFSRATAEADFLFGPDTGPIAAYLRDLSSHSNKLVRWNQEYIDSTQPSPPGYDHQAVVNGMAEEKQWFADQPKKARRLFTDYLNLWE